MVKIISKIKPSEEISETNNEMDLAKPKFKLTRRQRVIILTVITHDFVKGTADEFAKQLNAFSASLNGLTGPTPLATKYGYTAAELLAIKNDAAYFSYWNTLHGVGATYSKAWTKKGDEIRSGKGTSVSAWPVGADVSMPPHDVLPGVEIRFREKARKAKGQTSIYTEADGIVMNIEIINSVFVPADGMPELNIEISGGGHPMLGYIKSKYAGVNIYKDSGDGAGFKFLLTCNDPTCTDLSALPAAGKSAAWTYKAFYLFEGKEVGTISKPTSITVLGLV